MIQEILADYYIEFNFVKNGESAFHFFKTENNIRLVISNIILPDISGFEILTVLRILETGEIPRVLVCEERDFKNAISIIEVLIIHAKKVFSELPQLVIIPKRENREDRFF